MAAASFTHPDGPGVAASRERHPSWNEPPFAMILAGGFGTRIRHLLPDLPKPLAPVAGRPFLEWVVRFLAGQGCKRFGISTGYRAELIEDHFARNPVPGVDVACVSEEEPLGTAGGLRFTAATLKPPERSWLICNGDSLCLADLHECRRILASTDADGVVVGVPMADAARYGTLTTDASGRLVAFQEKRAGSGMINAGLYLLRPQLLGRFSDHKPLSLETDVFPSLLAQGVRLMVSVQDAPFLDIGTAEGLSAAAPFVRQHMRHFE